MDSPRHPMNSRNGQRERGRRNTEEEEEWKRDWKYESGSDQMETGNLLASCYRQQEISTRRKRGVRSTDPQSGASGRGSRPDDTLRFKQRGSAFLVSAPTKMFATRNRVPPSPMPSNIFGEGKAGEKSQKGEDREVHWADLSIIKVGSTAPQEL